MTTMTRTAPQFTRVTVVGTTHRCELAVPSQEPLANVLPRILDLVHEPVATPDRVLALVRVTGDRLLAERSLADQQVLDGEVVRLVRAEQAPPPCEVADVTDVVALTLGERGDRWSAATRGWTGAAALAVVAAIAAGRLPGHWQLPLAVVVAAAALAVLAGLLRDGWATLALTGVAIGAAVALALRWVPIDPPSGVWAPLPAATALGLLVWPCLGAGLGLARRQVPPAAGAAIGAAGAGLPLWISQLGPDRAAAVAATACTLVLGLLPRYAAMTTGLTVLDDQVAAGATRDRQRVRTAVDRAFATLTWSAAGAAYGFAVPAGVLLASRDPWSLAIGVTLVAAVALRTRSFPLAGQQLALWTGALVAVTTGVITSAWLRPEGVLVLAGGLGLAIVAGVCSRPPDHLRARFRRIGTLAETLCVIAVVPLLFGQFGIYTQLLGLFR